ncbi:hypothetical protein O181_018910 [Austropuccinia psidii MF-1]|uniref:Uncharacterized protein n=1 Tax=Austropuccinia psidii MF-1 TaxID=1389203 RepID=A0A9Q3C9K2_9BASI|nr:hypothetical protein [Austropuccinia psidii MF-1]
MAEVPEALIKTNEAFYVLIKLLWGLIYQRLVPISPNYDLLRDFNQKFPFAEVIKNVIESSTTMPLLPESEIITLRGATAGQWAPDLNDASDTLYNKVCRISAIQMFCQIAVSGAYEYININLKFLNSIHLLEASYNHYVPLVMAQRFKREVIKTGRFEKDEERKAILRARKRLRDTRYHFGVSHGFPKQYLKILAKTDAHSDNKYDSKKKIYLIKHLNFPSKKATGFMQRVDKEISKAEKDSGKQSQRAIRTYGVNMQKGA